MKTDDIPIVLFSYVLLFQFCNCIKNNNLLTELKKNVLKDYDKNLSPSNNVTVNFVIYITTFDLGHQEISAEITGLIMMNWFDERLKWDKTHYMNISAVDLKADKVWRPVLAIINNADPKAEPIEQKDEASFGKLVNIKYKGLVTYLFQYELYRSNICTSDYSKWPHNTITCTIKIAFPSYLNQNVTVKPYFDSNLSNYVYYKSISRADNRIDSVTNAKLPKSLNRTDDQIKIVIILKTNFFKEYVYLYPLIGIIWISLSLFFIDPNSPERTVLIGLLLTFTTGLLFSVEYYLPSINEAPFVVKITVYVYLTKVFSFIVMVLSRRMLTTNYNPEWLHTVTSIFVRNSILRNVFFLNLNSKMAAELIDEDEDGSLLINKSNKLQKQWRILTEIFNALIFMILLPISIYFILVIYNYL